ncbi:hypothetical protein LR48_Vigan09g021100 [Vigna angularis]|uniref:Cytochrome P450 n=2 Tax=Phaseolus angularis TaxID=3914 RepID=A0A0L9V9J2_PHAAN|nr:hypothetical protein LR48_Vigan09g021100 [Vigna angularis]
MEAKVKAAMRESYNLWLKKKNGFSEMNRWFGNIALNIMFQSVVGKRFFSDGDVNEENERLRKAFRELFDLSSSLPMSDCLPYLRWLDLDGKEKKMKRTAKEIDGFIQIWLEEHKRNRDCGSGERKQSQDLMDVLLGLVEEGEEFDGNDSDTTIKAMCLLVENSNCSRLSKEVVEKSHQLKQLRGEDLQGLNIDELQQLEREEGEIDAATGNSLGGDWCRRRRLGLSGRSDTAAGPMEALLCRRRRTARAAESEKASWHKTWFCRLPHLQKSLIMAGSDTTTRTLAWALSLLLNNREILQEAIKELDTEIGSKRMVEVSDLKKLKYLESIIKETLRLYPPAPLNLPHESMENCTVGGYDVAAGTRILTNLSKLQRDPSLYPNPLEFCPERFLTTHKEVDVKGQHFELIPFGAGRRMCPGISFGLQAMQLTLATLLHGFDIETNDGGPVDMVGDSPLQVILTSRLSSIFMIKYKR